MEKVVFVGVDDIELDKGDVNVEYMKVVNQDVYVQMRIGIWHDVFFEVVCRYIDVYVMYVVDMSEVCG